MENKITKLKDLENEEINWLVTDKELVEILPKIGYGVDREGYIIDAKTKEKIKAEDGLYINVKADKKLALMGGSHHFVRNSAGYVEFLVKDKQIEFK